MIQAMLILIIRAVTSDNAVRTALLATLPRLSSLAQTCRSVTIERPPGTAEAHTDALCSTRLGGIER
jgi:hypothetical protein